MNDTQSQTESLLDIVKGIHAHTIMLPEFQRDFRWDIEHTYDLFDSLMRDIFIGTLIYGKPSFGMTLREIDQRPRKGKGSNAPLATYDYSTSEISKKIQTQNLRVVLDGQQRLTSIYRAIMGLDNVYIILKNDIDGGNITQLTLEEMVESVAGEESPSSICVRVSDAFDAEERGLDDEDLNERFAQTRYAIKQMSNAEWSQRKPAEKIYRRAVRKLIDLFKQQKMVAYYMLDMSLDKFCLFFERSNSRGIQLDFTDILAAKLYHGFNLRKKIEEFESQSKLRLTREIIIRAIAYICSTERGGAVSIDKKFILEQLEASDFQTHWDETCNLYAESLQYLINQHYILSQDWMPSENMIIPLMIFRHKLKGFDQITQEQRTFLEYWYWASIFANRYSGSSNEVIINDCNAFVQIAAGERVNARGYFARMRSLVTEPDDLFSYTKKSSAIYRGLLNLLGYAAQGLKDWNNTQKIDVSMRLEDHHVYPRGYIASPPELDLDRGEAAQLVDCVVNRTLIPKLTNITVGKKAPQVYLSELQRGANPQLAECLPSHLIDPGMITEPAWNGHFRLFLDQRAKAIFALIERFAIAPAEDMATRFGIQVDLTESFSAGSQLRLKDMIADGKVDIGERIFVRKQPNLYATIVDGETVEFDGKQMPINTWGQQMTGWVSINIYESVILSRTGEPLGNLR